MNMKYKQKRKNNVTIRSNISKKQFPTLENLLTL